MDSSKSRRESSRQSSILKPPKPRQALQELNFSSDENTTKYRTDITTKIKRRVSFADKKHVKEFCNSLDQGTLWNNTYEEHDTSNLEVLGISIQEESKIQSVSIQQNAIQFFCNEAIENEISIKDCTLHTTNIAEDVNYQDKMQLTTVSLAFQDENDRENADTCLSDLRFENNSHMSKSITVYEGTDEKLLQSNIHNFINKKLNDTTLEETSMDLTQIVPNIVCSEANCIQNNTVEDIVNNESMELTETILPSMNIQSFQQFAKSTKAVTDLVDRNMSMELTAACIPKLVDNVNNAGTLMTLESDVANTKKLDNISMELTSAVCHMQTNDDVRNHCTTNTNDMSVSKDITTTATSSLVHADTIADKENRNTYNSSKYFSKSTKAVTDVVDQNISMELTAACIPKLVDNDNNAGTIMTLESDVANTKKLDNISMELTAAVWHMQTNDNARNHCITNTNDMSVSKDITTTATSSSVHADTIPDKENWNTSNSAKYFSKSTKAVTDLVDRNMSMELTAACIPKLVDNVNNAGTMTLESDVANTKKLDNISMELTSAVFHMQTNDDVRNHCTTNTNDMSVSKDITTTATSSTVHADTIADKENRNTYNSSKYFSKSTKAVTDVVDQNMSMELTAACIPKLVDNVNNAGTIMTLESDVANTKKLDNISMELTAAVWHMQTNDNARNHCTTNTKDMFVSKDITTTATSSSVHSDTIPDKENRNTYNSSKYFSKSTKAVTDVVDQNMSMELTAACIPKLVDNDNNAGTLMTLESDVANTKKLDNISMELTAAVWHMQTNDNARNHCTTNTKDMFVSKDITTTATSSSVHSDTIPDKENRNTYNSSKYFSKSTKAVTDVVDQNMSMELTAACIPKLVDNDNNAGTLMTLESDVANTKKLDNISMELTTALCHMQTNDDVRNHCTTNTNDMSVSKDITTTATSSSVHADTIADKENRNTYNSSKYFSKSTKAVTDVVDQNMSMELTAACIPKLVDNVNNAGTIMTLESDVANTKKLDNISMELTAAVWHMQTNDNARNHCTTNTKDMFVSKDITTIATSSSVHSDTIPDKENRNTYNSSKYFSKSTKAVTDVVDQNMSMELTAACIPKLVDNDNNAGTLMTLESDVANTKKLDNISMELTTALCHMQTNDDVRNHCTTNTNDMSVSKDITTTATSSSVHADTIPDKENRNTYNSSKYFSKSTKAVTDVVDQNMSMELTAPCIPKLVDNVNNAGTIMTLESDVANTKKLDNISMELTAAVWHMQTNDNARNHCTTNTKDMFVSKDITTTATSSSVHSDTIPDKENRNTSNSAKYFSKSTKAVTDLVDRNMSMELTAACIPKLVDNVNNAGMLMTLESDVANTKKLDNISMELTAAVWHMQTNDNARNHCITNTNDMSVSKDITTTATSSSVHSDTIPDKENRNTYNSAKYFSKSTKAVTDLVDRNMSMELTAACIPKLVDNVNNAGTIMTLESDVANTKKIDNISMELTTAVCHMQTNDNARNHCTTNTTNMFVSKDITTPATSSSLNSDKLSDKKNCIVLSSCTNLKNNSTVEFTPVDILNSDNIQASMALHDRNQQDTSASALKETNMNITCAVLNNSSYIINSDLSKNVQLFGESIKTTTFHPSNDQTYVIIKDGNSTKSNSRSSLQNVNNLETQEDHDIFFNYGSEELDSIKPPSFIDLDDLSVMETSVNVNYDQKINTTSCLLKNENNGRKHTLELEDQQVNIPEKVCKLQTSVNKYMSVDDELTSSILEQKDQVQTDKIQELDVRNANTGIQVLECSVVNDNGMPSMMSGSEKEHQNLHTGNFNSKENVMKCSLVNIISKIKNIDKLNDTQVVEVDGEHLKSHVSWGEQSIVNKLKICAKSDDIIWEVYCEDIERNIFAIGFISCSLLVVIFLQDSCDIIDNVYIKTIKIVSRLADDADVLISIVHRIILEKLDTNKLVNLYKKCEDILPMLDYISKEVKLAMDFMFDLKRLDDINLMEITRDSVSFISRSKKCDIILKVTVNIKSFDKIESQDISVHCLLGSIREEIVKKLITNIKRDHKFLRRYINDVKEYICLMEETGNVI
ncbi:unnamed protein product [Xylocopa violacea]|uniref:Uncharacterized protein n=1 Tax=Xylocopa violacea TaxID=135666 RepID=A0ABP1P188_XYLVO